MKSDKEEIVIEEFKTSRKKGVGSTKSKGYENYLILAVFGITFFVAILLGMFLLKLPVVLVCIILVLESVIGICLHDMPIWVHGIEIMISIVAGIIFGQTVFMIIGALIYIAAILALHFMSKQEGWL